MTAAKKKTFIDKDNPALQFISAESVENAENEESGEPDQEPAAEPKPQTAAPVAQASTAAPAGFRPDPRFIEKKTKRVQLIFKPSLYRKTKEAADAAGLSFNEYVQQTLEAADKKGEIMQKKENEQ